MMAEDRIPGANGPARVPERPLSYPQATVIAPGLVLGGLFDLFDSDLLHRLEVSHAVILGHLPDSLQPPSLPGPAAPGDGRAAPAPDPSPSGPPPPPPPPVVTAGEGGAGGRGVTAEAAAASGAGGGGRPIAPRPAQPRAHTGKVCYLPVDEDGQGVVAGEGSVTLQISHLEAVSDFIGAAQSGDVVLVVCGDRRGCSPSGIGALVLAAAMAASEVSSSGVGLLNVEHALIAVRDARPIAFMGSACSDAMLSVLVEHDRRLAGGHRPPTTVGRLRAVIKGNEAASDDSKTGDAAVASAVGAACSETLQSVAECATVCQSVPEFTASKTKLDPLSDEVVRHKNHIAEELLTLHCPECGMAFIDFTACFALWCSLCNCAFCAYCQQSCRDRFNDAHAHVARCNYNIAPHKSIFASRALFDHSQNLRRARVVKQYVLLRVKQ